MHLEANLAKVVSDKADAQGSDQYQRVVPPKPDRRWGQGKFEGVV
jgi:hypothetical protein